MSFQWWKSSRLSLGWSIAWPCNKVTLCILCFDAENWSALSCSHLSSSRSAWYEWLECVEFSCINCESLSTSQHRCQWLMPSLLVSRSIVLRVCWWGNNNCHFMLRLSSAGWMGGATVVGALPSCSIHGVHRKTVDQDWLLADVWESFSCRKLLSTVQPFWCDESALQRIRALQSERVSKTVVVRGLCIYALPTFVLKITCLCKL